MQFHGQSTGASCVNIGCKMANLFKFFLGSSQRERTIVRLVSLAKMVNFDPVVGHPSSCYNYPGQKTEELSEKH